MSQSHVVVVGAGAGGLAAALGAAQAGASVVLVERAERLGGTVARSLIHTLGGLYDDSGVLLNGGLCEELVERLQRAHPEAVKRRIGKTWTLTTLPHVYSHVVERWIAEHPSIRVLRGATVRAIDGAVAGAYRIEFQQARGRETIASRALIDASGGAHVVAKLDPDLVQVAPERAASGLIVHLAPVAPEALVFPRSLEAQQAIRQAVRAGELAPAATHAWIDRGAGDDDAYLKLTVAPDVSAADACTLGDAVVDVLRRQVPAFAEVRVVAYGEVGARDEGRLVGEYCLTEADVRDGGRFDDAAGRCAWPMEYWDPQRGVTLAYLPAGQYFEVPLRAFKARGREGLWVAGKSLCAEPRAQAAARVVGCCWATGEAVGRAAAGRVGKSEGLC